VIADLERGHHRGARDLERLDDEGAQEKGDGDGDPDRLGVLAKLALSPAREIEVDEMLGFGERGVEMFRVEGLFFHRAAQILERRAKIVALLGREGAFDFLAAAIEDAICFVEQTRCVLELAPKRARQVGTARDARDPGTGQGMALAPQDHLEQRKGDDADRNGLLAAERAQTAEDAVSGRIAVGDRQEPHREEGARERHRHEPDRAEDRVTNEARVLHVGLSRVFCQHRRVIYTPGGRCRND
jgi:hypothetical protein